MTVSTSRLITHHARVARVHLSIVAPQRVGKWAQSTRPSRPVETCPLVGDESGLLAVPDRVSSWQTRSAFYPGQSPWLSRDGSADGSTPVKELNPLITRKYTRALYRGRSANPSSLDYLVRPHCTLQLSVRTRTLSQSKTCSTVSSSTNSPQPQDNGCTQQKATARDEEALRPVASLWIG